MSEEICGCCDQIHDPKHGCPPFEVRTTGVAVYQMQIDWLKEQNEKLKDVLLCREAEIGILKMGFSPRPQEIEKDLMLGMIGIMQMVMEKMHRKGYPIHAKNLDACPACSMIETVKAYFEQKEDKKEA